MAALYSSASANRSPSFTISSILYTRSISFESKLERNSVFAREWAQSLMEIIEIASYLLQRRKIFRPRIMCVPGEVYLLRFAGLLSEFDENRLTPCSNPPYLRNTFLVVCNIALRGDFFPGNDGCAMITVTFLITFQDGISFASPPPMSGFHSIF
jgi:hypothetical protein